ncbi:ubiquitin-conjugating enzyme E2 J1 [Geosmithia morbida]|uniref:Ubiquitin-conjugating enzyme E2 J1 n=1 Tax=Geosmithia morbida TaxID=1094350 RepID=A0A9P4YQV7_9HYPO|nr:ubiquitin-conjugating enzyme E2 J1 [Geosmithia morbida]KAF4120142.1 ubiquitin-conjugating enzyme E2 J1 [Geosmithia morbida]
MASTPQSRTKSPTIKRILREAAELTSTPSPDYTAEPLETDLFEWHFTLRGPPHSAYSDGLYHGRIILPSTYPLRPPSFRFMTPNGRFEANREICLSISGHHEETWQPAWGIRTAIVALRSFMETDAHGQLGGYDTTEEVRRRLATESHSFRCPGCAKTNAEIIRECEERAKEADTDGQDVDIPEELSMGFKDQMGGTPENKSQAGGDTSDTNAASSSHPTPPNGTDHSAPSNIAEHPPPLSPRPAQAVPQPTRTIPAAHWQPQSRPAVNMMMRDPQNGVPIWIDRLIVGLVVVLAALVIKVMFGA